MNMAVRWAAWTAMFLVAPVFAQEAGPNSRLVVIEGSVMLNQGERFADAVVDTPTREGDRIMAMESSRAVVKFSDGCDLEVEAGTIVTVPETSPCAGAVVTVEKVAPTTAVASTGNTLLRPAILIPAAIVGACLAIDGGDDKVNCKDDPASP